MRHRPLSVGGRRCVCGAVVEPGRAACAKCRSRARWIPSSCPDGQRRRRAVGPGPIIVREEVRVLGLVHLGRAAARRRRSGAVPVRRSARLARGRLHPVRLLPGRVAPGPDHRRRRGRRRPTPPPLRSGRHDPTSVLLVTEDDRGLVLVPARPAAVALPVRTGPGATTALGLAVVCRMGTRQPSRLGGTACRHHGRPGRPFLARTGGALGAVGGGIGRSCERTSERLYVATAVALSGGWLAAASRLGTGHPPHARTGRAGGERSWPASRGGPIVAAGARVRVGTDHRRVAPVRRRGRPAWLPGCIRCS